MARTPEINLMHHIIHLTKNVEGDIAEFGVWKGGMAMWIKNLLNYYNLNKKLWLFDTFNSFPKSDINNKDSNIHPITEFLFDQQYNVFDNFKKFNLLDNNINFIIGKFQDTIPHTLIPKLSILRLDCDYYEPTMLILENYYNCISKNGCVIIDDYNNQHLGCKDAVDDFRKKHKIYNKIINLGDGYVYWIV
jgi:O-methyltransferase